jgi:hypothetical protein
MGRQERISFTGTRLQIEPFRNESIVDARHRKHRYPDIPAAD